MSESTYSSGSLRHYWHPVGWAEDVGEGPYATELLGERLVLWRTASGVLGAADRCPHRGTALSLGEVSGPDLVCPYHGWHFGPDGRCTRIPQQPTSSPIPERAALQRVALEERYGLLWVALEEPAAPIPDFPEWTDPAYRHVACPSYTWETSPGRMVENFTDFGHLGYLHDGLLGTRDDLEVPAHRVEATGAALHYELTMQVPNTNDTFAVTDLSGERGLQTNRYVLTLPFAIHLQCQYHDSDTHRTLFFAVQPIGPTRCTGYCYQSRDFELDAPDQPFADFQELLAEQDRPVVESQTPAELPLENLAELHLGFDRVAVAYRRALRAVMLDTLGESPTLVSTVGRAES